VRPDGEDREIQMRVGRLVALGLGVIAALGIVSPGRADPISVVLDTQNLATLTPPLTSLTLYFQFNGVDGESVAITDFATDGRLDDTSIATNGSVGGSLVSTLTLNGDSSGFLPSAEYFETIVLGNSIAFTFDVTGTNTGVGPLFAFSLLVDSLTALPPLDDAGQPIFGDPSAGMLVVFDASGEPMLSLYANDLVGVREGTVSSLLPEPGVLPLLCIALVALAMMGSHARILRLRG
jgi:hypothetical protein